MKHIREIWGYIYRVTVKDSEYTLRIVKNQNDKWQVSELKGMCNKPAPSEVVHAVQQWLHTSQNSRNKTGA